MSLDQVKTTFQVVIYSGTAITVLGAIIISSYPNAKLKWAFNFPAGVSISTLGAIILLIGTIFFNIYSNKVEKYNKDEFNRQLAARDKVIKKNAEQLLITNRFHAEIDNPIKSMFLF